jgi:uncharacterized protein (DUF433 family)
MLEAGLFGVGLYTVGEASRLTSMPPVRVRRWLHGYKYVVNGREFRERPIWSPEIPSINEQLYLGFRDLVELRVVNRFRLLGLSLQQLRKAHDIAQELLGEERPFSAAAFKTDGTRIYLEIARRTGEPELIDLLTRQQNFHSVVVPSLRSVEFDGDVAVRWWPESGAKAVVLDPKRSFGQHIIASAGIPTGVLADAYLAEGSYARAAAMFGVAARDVKAAVRFQQQIAA